MISDSYNPAAPAAAQTVLLIEDNPADARMMELLLQDVDAQEFQVEWCDRLQQGLNRLREGGIDVVLLDLGLPDATGIDSVVSLQYVDDKVPIIVLTGFEDQELATRAMQIGAQDYLSKGDIEEKLLERAIRYAIQRKRLVERSKAHLQTEQLVASISSVLIGLDETGLVTRWNRAAEETFSVAASQTIGRPFHKVAIAWHEEETPDRIVACQVADEPTELPELRFTGPNGEERLLRATVNPVKTSDDRLAGAVLLGNDITEQRRLQEQLRQSQKLECVGQMAAGVAHEFNNLLHAILSFTELALDDAGDEERVIEDLNQVLAATNRAKRITRQLLGFSRRQVLRKSDVDLNSVISDMTSMIRPMLGRHIELEISLDPDVPTIPADQSMLEQMLMNLCVNARDAMADGGKLQLTSRNVELDGSQAVELVVLDSGIGMPSDVVDRIFEPFFTTKSKGKGTGLGLAMVYGCVQQHQGSIRVESKPNRGTAFIIQFPVGKDAEAGTSARQSDPSLCDTKPLSEIRTAIPPVAPSPISDTVPLGETSPQGMS